jgi:hypothetical protein
MAPRDYGRSVFINCPFDAEYAPLFEAILFALHDLGFIPRSARQRLDSGETRLAKILELISVSRYSIHDLSRTELDAATALPRFNMPLELGLDLGCRSFGPGYADKSILIFDSDKYRYQQYISDLAGLDIQHHRGDPSIAIVKVRHWLQAASGASFYAGKIVYERYIQFRDELPRVCERLRLDIDDLSFVDFSAAIVHWLRDRT